MTKIVRYGVGIAPTQRLIFERIRTIITHLWGVLQYAPTSLKRPLSVDPYDGQFVQYLSPKI